MKNLIVLALIVLASPLYAEFTHTGEASVVLTGGNSQLSTYNFKTTNKYPFMEKYTLNFGGRYTLGDANDVIVARNWDANAKLDMRIFKGFGAFIGEKVEGDKFAGFELRVNTDVGISKTFIENKVHTLKSEFGYRNFYEKNVDPAVDSKNDHVGRLQLDYQFKEKGKYVFQTYIEYLPNFSETEDYLVNIGPSLTFSLSSMFSFKVGYEGRYDNQPAVTGNRKFDYLYTTSIISKL